MNATSRLEREVAVRAVRDKSLLRRQTKITINLSRCQDMGIFHA